MSQLRRNRYGDVAGQQRDGLTGLRLAGSATRHFVDVWSFRTQKAIKG